MTSVADFRFRRCHFRFRSGGSGGEREDSGLSHQPLPHCSRRWKTQGN